MIGPSEPSGESLASMRARWKMEGRYGDCGAKEDQPGSGICARHRRRRHVAVTVSLPGPLHHRNREEAESRGETVEQWLVAAAQERIDRSA